MLVLVIVDGIKGSVFEGGNVVGGIIVVSIVVGVVSVVEGIGLDVVGIIVLVVTVVVVVGVG